MPLHRLIVSSTLLALLVGCASGGLSHTVPESAIARVSGPDKVRIEAARAEVTNAQQQLQAQGSQQKQAEAAIAEADKGIAEAEKRVRQVEQQLEAAQREKERAELRKRLREEELALIEMGKGVAEAEVIYARARYELSKFEVVGRVESGSDPEYQAGLTKFKTQVAEAQVEVAARKEEAAQQASKVAELKRSVGE